MSIPSRYPFATVADTFADAARRWADHSFLCVLPETASHYGIDAGEWSYARAQARMVQLREQYAAAGYGHGHRVGLLLENRPPSFCTGLPSTVWGCRWSRSIRTCARPNSNTWSNIPKSF